MRPRAARRRRPPHSTDGATWYKDAIIYELRVRSFFDSNGDGIGDLAGLASKLDYLADLGVTALWLLPFYPSPLRDDGYDISDYLNVHGDLGTLDDFKYVLHEAHKRGLRVITELVLNHTSDQHPWFQRARLAPRGSPDRNFYVWSEDGAIYEDARIIFKDFETSNWTRDPVAHDYFWHRFYSHQPDLNYENPAVQEALFVVVDFWLGLGVDGLRLDAVPYLYEETGTACENLPKTHAFLRRLRAHVDDSFPDRMLLAEANQWPEDAVAYFGNDDECHMNFHFPLMPRMFMAIHMEDSLPLADILAQTPAPPPTGQWALFLRNHDELTLETVTDDERDYMVRAYARDSAARINLGIRRRLAPLVENDRRKLELLNGLLLSLAGTPVIYYGDEIGMGDNVYLGDRDGVRTPMQWSPDRNAGFSRANPQRLILPVNVDPVYHYESVNVEAQQATSSSLLWWTKRILAVRREFRAFGRGALEVLTASNSCVFAFLRRLDDETVLVVANLARTVQFVELDLSGYQGLRPVDMFGGSEFPEVGGAPYALTLSGHAFYWFSLERADDAGATSGSHDDAAPVTATGLDALLGAERSALEERLPEYLAKQRWFRGRGRDAVRARIVQVVDVGTSGDRPLRWVVVRVERDDGVPDAYSLLLTLVPGALLDDGRFSGVAPLAMISGGDGPADVVVDALDDAPTSRTILEAIAERRSFGTREKISGVAPRHLDVAALRNAPRRVPGPHANELVQFDERLLLKLFRRLPHGTSLDLELSRGMPHRRASSGPEILGALELVAGGGVSVTLGLLETYVSNAGTAWHRAVAELGRYFDRVLTGHRDEEVPPPPATLSAGVAGAPALVRELMGPFLDATALLGSRIAEMHRDLMTLATADQRPEASSRPSRRADYQTVRGLAGVVLRDLKERRPRLSARAAADADFVLERKAVVLRRLEALLDEGATVVRMRIHGNLHLEQVLLTARDFVILDYEGEVDRSSAERRRKQCPLRDVAGMMRSLENAALVAVWESAAVRDTDRESLAPWARLWSAWAGAALVSGYREAATDTALVPERPDQADGLLAAFGLERALRDLRNELLWSADGPLIPLRAIVQSLEPTGPSPTSGPSR